MAADEPQRAWSASRTFSRPVMHGLFADTPIPAGAFISEYRGELYSADRYRKDPINQYASLGAVKPHVHLFPPPLNLAIDARRFGNEARFARFSCHPNAVLRPILFRQTGVVSGLRSHDGSRSHSPAIHNKFTDGSPRAASDEPELLFGIFAINDIARTHEITLGWEWDDAHIVHFLPDLV
ncbi:SET domain-containing protein, partial [Violaceomyces palustris]